MNPGSTNLLRGSRPSASVCPADGGCYIYAMRLTPEQHAGIKEVVKEHDPAARVFLFGSRVDDSARGGDIDLVIESRTVDFSKKLSILVALKDRLGDQKIDIVLTHSLKDDTNPFLKVIEEQMVLL